MKFFKSKFFFLIISVCFVLSVLFLSNLSTVFAQQGDTFGLVEVEQNIDLGSQDIRITIAKIIRTILGLLGILAVSIVLYGGFVYMTAGGSEEKVAQAKKILINGVIGLTIILSSFAITQFVLSKLSDATGSGSVGLTSNNCSSTDYAQVHPSECFADFTSFCQKFPSFCASSDFFYVKSITPSTPNSATGMNNIVIRAVFSKPIASNVDVNSILSLEYGGVSQPIDIKLSQSRQVAEAIHTVTTALCETIVLPPNETCLEIGDYSIKINPDLKDTAGRELTTSISGQDYPVLANFSVDVENIDHTAPQIIDVSVNGSNSQDQNLAIGDAHTLRLAVLDNTGVGFVNIIIKNIDSGKVITETVEGPSVSDGSSGEFDIEYPIVLGQDINPLSRFEITATAYDIDHNSAISKLNFVALANHCNNGVQDGDETGVDNGGSCSLPANSFCDEDWQCSSKKCVNNQCMAWPMITDVDAWDGAEGNWVTVAGQFFGDKEGKVEFGYDSNNDGSIDKWIESGAVLCSSLSSWKDSWIIVPVPSDSDLPMGSESAVRVTLGDGTGLADSTVDDHGPISGPNNGLFTKNDVKKPSICSVLSVLDTTSAEPNSEISLSGKNFNSTQGTSIVEVGGAQTTVATWESNAIKSKIPQNMRSGKVVVHVEVDGQKSNSVPFTVLPFDKNFTPLIDSISPSSTTPGSFVTLSGTGFGESTGFVFISPNSGVSCEDTVADECTPVELSLPNFCGDTWNSGQVVIQIPDNTQTGNYYIVLKNDLGLITDGLSLISIVPGDPRPSICKMTPQQGPAPLPVGSTGLEISGINFSSDPTIYFWWKNSVEGNTNTWLNSTGNNVNQIQPDKIISSIIPSTIDGYSMKTGPIVVGSDVGELSNAMSYEVSDCRDVGAPAGYQCCTVGPDAGMVKPKEFICAGEVRDAGYAWRFTSGFLPNIPQVVEQCPDTGIPSPSPWVERKQGANVCLNATPTVLFTMGMDDSSLSGNVRVITCGTDELSNCEDENVEKDISSVVVDVTSDFTFRLLGGDVLSLDRTEDFATNTWYRIELEDGLQSQEIVTILGTEQTVNQGLLASKPCGEGTSYCYEFKTGEGLCTLTSASVKPANYTTQVLGTILDKRFPKESNVPLYYYLFGRGDQECTVLNVDGLGWDWRSESVSKATVNLSVGSGFVDSRSEVSAVSQTAPSDVKIFALSNSTPLKPESSLVVDLEDPKIISYWPNCSESCVNSGLGVEFNREMDVNAFYSSFKLSECLDEFCNAKGNGIPLSFMNSDSFTLQAFPTINLNPNTWYLAEVLSGIKAIEQKNPISYGKELPPFSWKFRTKNDSTLCSIDRVLVQPIKYKAFIIGDKKQYKAVPMSSANECSPVGQKLNPWDYAWLWESVDPQVAKVSNFETVGTSQSFCTDLCLLAGSNINSDVREKPALCGNGVVESGEDCDIASIGELVGVSCSLSCLRLGSNTPDCGNGAVEPLLGEECDIAVTSTLKSCSNNCLWEGSSTREPSPTEIDVSWCGSGSITVGEDCDTKDPLTQKGCSNKCLHIGSQASSYWCERNKDLALSTTSTIGNSNECLVGLSICGNGLLENGEECEIVDGTTINLVGVGNVSVSNSVNVCSTSCLISNACGETGIPSPISCDSTDEGCNKLSCTKAGSSVNYSISSLCNDGVIGIGENNLCESSSAPTFGQIPTQIVTAVGDGVVNPSTRSQDTTIRVKAEKTRDTNGNVINIASEFGEANYSLECGYTEFETFQNNRFNDCPNAVDGVATNSCCYPRPKRSSEYPLDGAGLGNASEPVCLNTFIEAHFDEEIDKSTVNNNSVLLARGYPMGYNCSQNGEEDVSERMKSLLTLGESKGGIWSRVWQAIKNFFVRAFKLEVFASNFNDSSIEVWCVGSTNFRSDVLYQEDQSGKVVSTDISLSLTNLLQKDTVYAVMFKNSIKNEKGVGIVSPDNLQNTLDDSWIFKTGNEVCKIDNVFVRPDNKLFARPNTTSTFVALAESKTGQRIVSIENQYSWEWHWAPLNNAIFDVTNSSSTVNIIGSKDLEGNVLASANAVVTKDVSESNNQFGDVFSGTTNLSALFCENPWPQYEYFPFEDGISYGGSKNNDGFDQGIFNGGEVSKVRIGGAFEYFNFKMGYCADSGSSNNITDDLPYLKPVALVNEFDIVNGNLVQAGNQSLSEDTLKKYFFFNEKNDDVIGIQIFMNPNRLTAREWYIERFGSDSGMTETTVAGYDAITDNNSFYINALNEGSSRDIFNNIYLFSINGNAQSNTRSIFNSLVGSLEFNINISNFNSCSQDGDMNQPNVEETIECNTDFECLDLTTSGGVCANAKTKFKRDWKRLLDLQVVQEKLDFYKLENSSYPKLASGSFIPNYTVSKWSSWANLSNLIGGATLDPVNEWSGCNGLETGACWDAEQSQYVCPQKASVYEYSFDNTTNNYTLYTPFEYFNESSNVVKEFLDVSKISSERWCIPGITYNSSSGVCGDNIVNIGEQCDPQGSISYTNQTCNLGELAPVVCQDDCTAIIGTCTSVTDCGNGRVEVGETCDDGTQNGTYGSCNIDCTGSFVEYCGNASKDGTNEVCDINELTKITGFCKLNKTKSCSDDSDCGEIKDYGTCDRYEKDTKNILMPVCSIPDENGNFISCNPADIPLSRLICKKILPTFGTCISASDPTYSYKKENTCAWDCQDFGSYCGDRIVQGDYGETCDDGNLNNGDGCNEFCVLEASQNTSQSSLAPSCGDGIVDKEILKEVCDLGGQNGIKCNPNYGESCNYCSLDCKNVLTVDPIAYCGNEKVDEKFVSSCSGGNICSTTSEYETCDVNSSGVVIEKKSGVLGFSALTCPDKGSYSCNSCNATSNTCVSCVLDSSGKLSTPKIAILNPMIGNVIPTDTTNNRFGSKDEYVALYRPSNVTQPFLMWTSITGKNFIIDSSQQNYMSMDTDGSLYKTEDTIEGNELCSGEYNIFFNHRLLYGAVKNNIQGYQDKNITDGIFANPLYGDLFPYPVDGTAEINNDVIYSPAVPPGVFRVVVKWTDKEAQSNVLFSGIVQSNALNPSKTLDGVVSYMDAKAVPNDGRICDQISLKSLAELPINGTRSSLYKTTFVDFNKYWWPTKDINCASDNVKRIYVHPEGKTQRIYTQSFTIDTYGEVGNNYSFVVQAVGGSVEGAPIATFQNSDLEVEVYTYHSGQVPQVSVFKPTYTFKIKNSTKSSNPVAKYWSVFNLKFAPNINTGDFQVIPIDTNGSIETDWVGVKEHFIQ